MTKTKKRGSSNINFDIVKRDAAERRKQDIEMHGKPTAFRPSMTKNKKAYSRKEKHKVSLTESDLNLIVAECVERLNEYAGVAHGMENLAKYILKRCVMAASTKSFWDKLRRYNTFIAFSVPKKLFEKYTSYPIPSDKIQVMYSNSEKYEAAASFSEIWGAPPQGSLLALLREKKLHVKGRCAGCRWLDVCGGNFRARGEAATGELWGEDPACYLTDDEIQGSSFYPL